MLKRIVFLFVCIFSCTAFGAAGASSTSSKEQISFVEAMEKIHMVLYHGYRATWVYCGWLQDQPFEQYCLALKQKIKAESEQKNLFIMKAILLAFTLASRENSPEAKEIIVGVQYLLHGLEVELFTLDDLRQVAAVMKPAFPTRALSIQAVVEGRWEAKQQELQKIVDEYERRRTLRAKRIALSLRWKLLHGPRRPEVKPQATQTIRPSAWAKPRSPVPLVRKAATKDELLTQFEEAKKPRFNISPRSYANNLCMLAQDPQQDFLTPEELAELAELEAELDEVGAGIVEDAEKSLGREHGF